VFLNQLVAEFKLTKWDLTSAGGIFLHRWSNDGLSCSTPSTQPRLANWETRLTGLKFALNRCELG
jgi:hypothetical protein